MRASMGEAVSALPFERIAALTRSIQEKEGLIAERDWLAKLPPDPDYVTLLTAIEMLLHPALRAVNWRIMFPGTSPALALGHRGFETRTGRGRVSVQYVSRNLPPEVLDRTLRDQAPALIKKLEEQSKRLNKKVRGVKRDIKRLREKRKGRQKVLRLLRLVTEAKKKGDRSIPAGTAVGN